MPVDNYDQCTPILIDYDTFKQSLTCHRQRLDSYVDLVRLRDKLSWLLRDAPTRPLLPRPAVSLKPNVVLGPKDGAYKCRDPRPLFRNGRHSVVGCGTCFWCHQERKVRRFRRIKRRIDKRSALGQVPYFVTLNVRSEHEDFLSPQSISKAASAALQALSRARKGLRGATAWPGLDFEFLRSPGVNESGVCHFHAMLWVSEPSPSCSAIRVELSSLFDAEIKKALGKQGERLDSKPMGQCYYLEPCETVLGSARYIVLGQEDEANPLPVGLRMSYSRGL